MAKRLLVTIIVLFLLPAWRDSEPSWPLSGASPDDPVRVRPSQYAPIGVGTKSYRPVEPMPWGDVNRRVEPQGAAQKPTPQPVSPPNHDGH